MKKRSYSLQAHLLVLLVVALLPILVVGTIATVLGARQLHQAALQQLQDNAAALADMVDQRFIGYAQILRLKAAIGAEPGISYLPPIQADAVKHSELALMDLRDPQQRTALPADFLMHLASNSGISVSDLQYRADTESFSVAIGLSVKVLPAISNFALQVPATEIIDFSQTAMPEGLKDSLISVLDSQGRIVARSRNQAQWLGQLAPDWDKLKAIPARQDWLSIETFEGAHALVAFNRLDVAKDWVLVIAEDQQAIDTAWIMALWGIFLGLLATAVVSFLLARWTSQRILKPLQQVQSNSRAILDWQDTLTPNANPNNLGIREFDELSTNLIEAHSLLKDQSQQTKDLSQQLLRNEARHRTMAEVGALVFWQACPKWQVLQLIGWYELTGQPETEALGRGWIRRIHPNDWLSIATNNPNESAIDAEFRILDVNERWHWVRARGTRINNTQGDQAEWAGVLEDVDARLQAQAQIGYLAKFDALTGLVNRSHFHEVLVAAIASAQTQSVAVLSMDLDRFMDVNDSLGHDVGDELLKRVTARLIGLLPQDGLLARFGGDEFAVLFTTSSPKSDIQALSERILAAFEEPFVIDAHSINAHTCIGAAWSQSPNDSAEQIMRHAALALHHAKVDGRQPMRFFVPTMEHQMRQRRQMEVDLRNGLQQAQFYLVYQPLVDLPTLELVGFEALLRWQHPSLGVLTPGRFIHIAEEIGLMDQLGAWVLAQACQDAKAWPDERLTVAVNIAASQLNAQLGQKVSQVLADTGLTYQRLELEVTENALMAHIEEAAHNLLQLQQAGVAIVLDDFGTGFTSLSHLRAFPFNKVKIDKGFVHDLSTKGHEQDGEAIIDAISLLCQRLGIVAVAEGVETPEQMHLIRRYECTQAQGFLLGRPLNQAQTCQVVTDWPRHQQRLQNP